MRYDASDIDEYIDLLPEERKEAIQQLRNIITTNIPEGFEETLSYGMISYVVPFHLYPQGYHAKAKEPLPFISIASQKNHIAFYHMGIYAMPELLAWFQEEYSKLVTTKLDIGKGCIRFRNLAKIPYELLGKLCSKVTLNEYINIYENVRNR